MHFYLLSPTTPHRLCLFSVSNFINVVPVLEVAGVISKSVNTKKSKQVLNLLALSSILEVLYVYIHLQYIFYTTYKST